MSFNHAMDLLVIPDGLSKQGSDGSWQIHPALQTLPEISIGRWIKRQWFSSTPLRTSLEWYVHFLNERGDVQETMQNATAWLMNQANLPANTKQCWQVMPFIAQIRRSEVHVLPSYKTAYTPADAQWLAKTINPLLHDLNMELLVVGAALLLCTQQSLDVQTVSFANIDGHTLPNYHPKGQDAAFFMRVLSEIQMLLHSSNIAKHRQEMPAWHGLWVWHGVETKNMPNIKDSLAVDKAMAIKSNDPIIASLCPREDASLTIAMSEQIIASNIILPAQTLLAGAGQYVLLSRTRLPRWHGKKWQA
ncbi:MAG: hypothetical protein R8L53_01815 [Mariprofundales bacterium]